VTITYEFDGATGFDSGCTPATAFNKNARLGRIDSTFLSRLIPPATTDEISMSWTTPGGEPGFADWPLGAYVARININAIDSVASIKFQLLRVQSGCTVDETLGTSGSVSTTGNKTFTVNTDPTSGAAGDRFQCRILGSNSDLHMTQNFTINPDISTRSVIEGPWSVGGIAIPIVYHHRQRNF